MWPASAPYPTESLFSTAAIPSEPIIIVVRALANLLWNFIEQEWRKNIRQMNLVGSIKVSLGEFEVLAHHAKVDTLAAKDVPDLAQHFFDAHVGAHIARAIVSGEEQL